MCKLGPYLRNCLARMVGAERQSFAPEYWAGYVPVITDATVVTNPGAKGLRPGCTKAMRLIDLRIREVHVTDEDGRGNVSSLPPDEGRAVDGRSRVREPPGHCVGGRCRSRCPRPLQSRLAPTLRRAAHRHRCCSRSSASSRSRAGRENGKPSCTSKMVAAFRGASARCASPMTRHRRHESAPVASRGSGDRRDSAHGGVRRRVHDRAARPPDLPDDSSGLLPASMASRARIQTRQVHHRIGPVAQLPLRHDSNRGCTRSCCFIRSPGGSPLPSATFPPAPSKKRQPAASKPKPRSPDPWAERPWQLTQLTSNLLFDRLAACGAPSLRANSSHDSSNIFGGPTPSGPPTSSGRFPGQRLFELTPMGSPPGRSLPIVPRFWSRMFDGARSSDGCSGRRT